MANERSNPWPTMALLGVLCGIALGAVVVIFFRGGGRRRQLQLGPGSQGLGGYDDDDGDDDLEAMLHTPLTPPQRPQSRLLAPIKHRPIARTMTISSREPTLLIKAVGTHDWRVWVRVISPPCALVTFMIGHDTGDSAIVPSGGFIEMQIPCGEFLFAQSDIPGVKVSVAGGEK